jgi:hypothetical protein
MTERPQPSPEQLARLAALRQSRPTEVSPAGAPARAPQGSRRAKPAQLSKIVTAGVSTSLVLGLVTAMGWHASSTATADTAPTPQPAVGPITLVSAQPLADPGAVVTVTLPATPPPVVDPIIQPLGAAPATVPAATAPAPTTAAPAPVPVVIDVAVPAPQPAAQPASNGASNGQTKQSK